MEKLVGLKIDTVKLKRGGEVISVLWKDDQCPGWCFSAISINQETLEKIWKLIQEEKL